MIKLSVSIFGQTTGYTVVGFIPYVESQSYYLPEIQQIIQCLVFNKSAYSVFYLDQNNGVAPCHFSQYPVLPTFLGAF